MLQHPVRAVLILSFPRYMCFDCHCDTPKPPGYSQPLRTELRILAVMSAALSVSIVLVQYVSFTHLPITWILLLAQPSTNHDRITPNSSDYITPAQAQCISASCIQLAWVYHTILKGRIRSIMFQNFWRSRPLLPRSRRKAR